MLNDFSLTRKKSYGNPLGEGHLFQFYNSREGVRDFVSLFC